MTKGENIHYKQFLLLPQYFQKLPGAIMYKIVSAGHCGTRKKVNPQPHTLETLWQKEKLRDHAFTL